MMDVRLTLPAPAERQDALQQRPRDEVEPGSGIQAYMSAGPSVFTRLGQKQFGELSPRDRESAAVDFLRSKYAYLVDERIRAIVGEQTSPSASRKKIDKTIAAAVKNFEESLKEFFTQASMAKTPSGFNRVHLDAFAMVFGDRAKVGSGDPLDDIVFGHGDLSISNLELRRREFQCTVDVHDFESAGLMPRRYEFNKAALGMWFEVMEAKLSDRMTAAIKETGRKVLAARLNKTEARVALLAWTSVQAGETTREKFAKDHPTAAEAFADIEQSLRKQRAQECVAALFRSFVRSTNELHTALETDSPITTPPIRPTSFSTTLQEALPYQLRYEGRLEATYLDEAAQFAPQVKKSKREIRKLGKHHRGVWLGAVNALERDVEVVDVVGRQGAGGASQTASIKRLIAAKDGEDNIIAQAKSPLPSQNYLWSFNVLGKVLAGVPDHFWLSMTNHAERAILARQVWQGDDAPEEHALEVGGVDFLYARRDPGRTSLDLKYFDTDTIMEIARAKGRLMAEGHFRAWSKLSFLRHGERDLRSGIDASDFVTKMVEQAESDAMSMAELADLASDYTGGSKALKGVLLGFAEESAKGLIGTFRPYERPQRDGGRRKKP
ncbi:MAG: DUF2252 family protein [Myxococcota bacterium]